MLETRDKRGMLRWRPFLRGNSLVREELVEIRDGQKEGEEEMAKSRLTSESCPYQTTYRAFFSNLVPRLTAHFPLPSLSLSSSPRYFLSIAFTLPPGSSSCSIVRKKRPGLPLVSVLLEQKRKIDCLFWYSLSPSLSLFSPESARNIKSVSFFPSLYLVL